MKILEKTPALIDRLAAHRAIGNAPRHELEWLAAHGELRRYEVGEVPQAKGTHAEHMVVQLTGRVSTYVDRPTGRRFVLETRGGEITAVLPFSRGGTQIGEVTVLEPVEALFLHRDLFPELIRECPTILASIVHVSIDRVRAMTSTTAQDEKVMSLGRLAAGLAHELNNPASAASRSAKQLVEALAESHRAAEALGALGLTEKQRELIDEVASGALMPATTGVYSALQRADLEEEVTDWLDEHDADHAPAESLADSGVTRESLDALADEFAGNDLNVVLRWIGAEYVARTLATEVQRATTRIHDLVSAVKRFTYVDRAAAPELVDVAQGLTDTVAVLRSKAKEKSVGIELDAPDTLPRVMANAGELNQVWANLIENAIDAVSAGGSVTVSARQDGGELVVRVIDDGPGVPAEIRERIFEPFFTTKPIGQGTGLGLDIARRVVQRFDGHMALESRPGRTEFRVVLPVAKTDVAA
ncbi:MAG TPA: ATP-binding protein [Gemmatimonadaceae bacterium]|nr:ATP-binding protein [Gemmatimonadaceae bacterium]